MTLQQPVKNKASIFSEAGDIIYDLIHLEIAQLNSEQIYMQENPKSNEY